MTTDLDRIQTETGRKLTVLLAVQQAYARKVVADRILDDYRRQALAAGCTTDEIAGAIRIVERAS
jgi:hypothetical protein